MKDASSKQIITVGICKRNIFEQNYIFCMSFKNCDKCLIVFLPDEPGSFSAFARQSEREENWNHACV